MSDALLFLLAALAAFFGMVLFALALPAHWTQIAGPRAALSPSAQTLLRGTGAAALAASFALCLAADHPTMAVLVWVMLLALSAWAVAMVLARRPA